MSTKADRVAATKADLLTAGYSAASAGALALVEDIAARSAIAHVAGASGVTDGTARAYLIKLLAWKAGTISYPTAPKSLTPTATRYINGRVDELAADVDRRRQGYAA